MSAFLIIVGVVWLALSIILVLALAAAAGRERPKPWPRVPEQISPKPADQAVPRPAWAFWRRRRLPAT